jgi:hypothetical protein
MITSMIYDHAARRHCYELLADAFALAPPPAEKPERALASGGSAD